MRVLRGMAALRKRRFLARFPKPREIRDVMKQTGKRPDRLRA